MKVLKFGGTSVGTAASLRNVKEIVERTERPAIVVVSALGGITDMLIATARLAAEGREQDYREKFDAIRRRHTDVIAEIVAPAERQRVGGLVGAMLDELERIYLGVYYVSDISERVLDRIVSYGERMSSVIVSGIIEGIELHDSRQFIHTRRVHNRHRLDGDVTARLIGQQLADAARPGRLTLVQGFIASDDATGDVTNLGRGGSDYTAAILASAFDADILEIWTDVDGFLTSDPRKVSGTQIIDRMSFVEAMDLCNFGAKVVYPPTIYPVFHKNIPVVIKNTFNPSAPGTVIADSGDAARADGSPRGISSLPAQTILTLRFSQGHTAADVSRVLNAMGRKGIDAVMFTSPEAGPCVRMTVRDADADDAADELRLEFAPESAAGSATVEEPRRNLSIIAVVGENLACPGALLADLTTRLRLAGIDALAESIGTSGSNIAIVVGPENEKRALQTIHDHIFRAD